MNKDNINISNVETYLNSIFDNVISANTFFGEMISQELIDAEWKDMVLVEIPNGINDFDAFGRGTVLVWLYARPLASGRKNVAVMSQLESRLNEVIANANDKNYVISRRLTYTDYDEDINWHCNVVEIILKVF
jgi:hypothetical protein